MEIIQNCVFDTLQSSNITTQIAQDMGFTITNDTKNKQEAESIAKSSASQKNAGLTLESSLYSLIALGLIIVLAGIMVYFRYSLKGKALSKDAVGRKPHLKV